MPTPWFTLRKSDAPPRPPWRQIAAVTVMSIMALIVLAFIGEITGFALLTPPLAASMALIAGCPNLPLSQPRNVICGQLLSAIVGCAVGVVSHSIWALAIAGGLALGVMLAARAAHSPRSNRHTGGCYTFWATDFYPVRRYSCCNPGSYWGNRRKNINDKVPNLLVVRRLLTCP